MLEQVAADHSGLIREQFVRQIRKVFSGILATAEGQRDQRLISAAAPSF